METEFYQHNHQCYSHIDGYPLQSRNNNKCEIFSNGDLLFVHRDYKNFNDNKQVIKLATLPMINQYMSTSNDYNSVNLIERVKELFLKEFLFVGVVTSVIEYNQKNYYRVTYLCNGSDAFIYNTFGPALNKIISVYNYLDFVPLNTKSQLDYFGNAKSRLINVSYQLTGSKNINDNTFMQICKSNFNDNALNYIDHASNITQYIDLNKMNAKIVFNII